MSDKPHVLKVPIGNPLQTYPRTYCGERAGGWMFQTAEHAMRTVAQRQRLLPCPKCWARIGAGEVIEAAEEPPLLVEEVQGIREDERKRCLAAVDAVQGGTDITRARAAIEALPVLP